jgi:hypothetical protein
LIVLWAAGLAACSGSPPAVIGTPAEPGKPARGCAQSEWQAQTAPVINKRQGNEALEEYAVEVQEEANGCR